MQGREEQQDYARRSLRSVGLGPIFRRVIIHSEAFDMVGFVDEVIKPAARHLGFACVDVITEPSSNTTWRPDDRIVVGKGDEQIEAKRRVERHLILCEQQGVRPLLILFGCHNLLQSEYVNFTYGLRTILDIHDTTAVLFVACSLDESRRMFFDPEQPFYLSASLDKLDD